MDTVGEDPKPGDGATAGPLPVRRRRSARSLSRDVGLPLLAIGLVVGAILVIERLRTGPGSGAPQTDWVVNSGASSSIRLGNVGGGSPRLGTKAPDFRLPAPDGTVVELSQFAGRPVLVNFWATWCIPCRAETPDLIRLQKSWGTSVQLLGVDDQEMPADVTAFAKEFGTNYPLVLDSSGDVFNAYHIYGIPETFFIDSGGMLRDYRIGILTPSLARCIVAGMANSSYRPKDCR